MATSTTRYGSSATAGASWKTVRSAAGRDDVLLLHELHAVGDQLRPAVEAAGVHRAEPALHVRHHLVLGLADEQRQREEGARAAARPRSAASTHLDHRGHRRASADPTRRVGHAGRRVLRRPGGCGAGVGLAGLLGARPGLGDPGGQHEVLAQRVALEAVGQQQRHQVAGGRRSRCRTSRTSRARARTRRRRPRSRSPARGVAAAPGCAAAGARGAVDRPQVGRRRRSPVVGRSSSSTRGQPVEEGAARARRGPP